MNFEVSVFSSSGCVFLVCRWCRLVFSFIVVSVMVSRKLVRMVIVVCSVLGIGRVLFSSIMFMKFSMNQGVGVVFFVV